MPFRGRRREIWKTRPTPRSSLNVKRAVYASSVVGEMKRRRVKETGDLRRADLAKRISRYIDYRQNKAYVRKVVSRAPMAEVGKTLVSMLRNGDRQAASDADLFAHDAV